MDWRNHREESMIHVMEYYIKAKTICTGKRPKESKYLPGLHKAHWEAPVPTRQQKQIRVNRPWLSLSVSVLLRATTHVGLIAYVYSRVYLWVVIMWFMIFTTFPHTNLLHVSFRLVGASLKAWKHIKLFVLYMSHITSLLQKVICLESQRPLPT